METYYLTDSQNELDRLAFQYRVWAEETAGLWKRAQFKVNDDILDLGCGPGHASISLSQLVGEQGTVTAVDSSEKFISHLNKKLEASEISNVTTQVTDINQLTFPTNSFDGIYSRMVMCFLRDPKQVLTQMVKMLRPGGKIVITDFFSYSESFHIVPQSSIIDKAMAMIEKGNTLSGGNFSVQKEVPCLLADLGLKIIDTKAYVRTAHPKEPLWNWPESYFRNLLPKMVEMNFMTSREVDHFWKDWIQRKKDSNSFILGPTLLDLVAEKPAV